MTKEEQAIIKEWERARTRWWTYSPTQLRKLEKQANEIYEKYENQK